MAERSTSLPRCPLNTPRWEDGRTWDRPILRCSLFGHTPVREFSKDLGWTFERCLRCGCRSQPEQVEPYFDTPVLRVS